MSPPLDVAVAATATGRTFLPSIEGIDDAIAGDGINDIILGTYLQEVIHKIIDMSAVERKFNCDVVGTNVAILHSLY